MDWRGHTAVILASGPSLAVEQCELVRLWREADGGRVVVINTTYRRAPWADVLYACDWTWWQHHYQDVRRTFRGALWTQDDAARDRLAIHHIHSTRGVGLSRDPAVIHQGGWRGTAGNGGYQAVNLVYHWGVRRIVLVGFDMKPAGKRTHWHEPHALNVTSNFASWVKAFKPLALDLEAEGVELLNATPDSALDCFRKVALDEVMHAGTLLAA